VQIFSKKSYLNKFNKDNKNNVLYVQHFLNLFLQDGKGYFAEILYKNFLTIHKHNKIHFLLNLFKIVRYLQFFLLLKGYRYKVGRGVIKIRYFLTPVSILRQYFLSFFYFLAGVKKRADVCYYNKVFLEFFQLIFFDENFALETITHLYTLAQQSRMFVPKKKRVFLKRSSTVKKVTFIRSKLKFFLLNMGTITTPLLIANRYRFLQAQLEQVYFLFCLRKRLVLKNKYKYNKQIKFLKNFKTLLKKKMLLLLFKSTLRKFRRRFLTPILSKH
jgi:hypothetical protein